MINGTHCEKCNKLHERGVAMLYVWGMWLCGECLHTHQQKVNAQHRKMIIEE